MLTASQSSRGIEVFQEQEVPGQAYLNGIAEIPARIVHKTLSSDSIVPDPHDGIGQVSDHLSIRSFFCNIAANVRMAGESSLSIRMASPPAEKYGTSSAPSGSGGYGTASHRRNGQACVHAYTFEAVAP